jgi:hypothetical protein
MLILEGGYVIQQDYMKKVLVNDEAKDYNAFNLFDDIYAWWWNLPPEERPQTPLPKSPYSCAVSITNSHCY